jgi:hypothetical protein
LKKLRARSRNTGVNAVTDGTVRHRRITGRGLVRRAAHRAPAHGTREEGAAHESGPSAPHDSCVTSRQNESVWPLCAVALCAQAPRWRRFYFFEGPSSSGSCGMQLAVCAAAPACWPVSVQRWAYRASSSSEAAAFWERHHTNRVHVSPVQ